MCKLHSNLYVEKFCSKSKKELFQLSRLLEKSFNEPFIFDLAYFPGLCKRGTFFKILNRNQLKLKYFLF